ncbi:MAG TPA: condensation domain-containing protein, partial [Terriglobales bacterium]|nr:condensation domain-containing protein [Terriglobales bacterium]
VRFQGDQATLSPTELQGLRARKAEILEFLETARPAVRAPLRPRAFGQPIPLAGLQRAALALGADTPHPRSCAAGVRILGPLSFRILENSLRALCARHEALRTRIVMVGGNAIQEVNAFARHHLNIEDLRTLKREQAEATLMQLIREFREEKINLATDPLFSSKLFKLSAQEHVLVLSIDHMITDAVSNAIILADLWAMYEHDAGRTPLCLARIPIQYPDYAVWQRETYGAWLEAHGPYWKNRLADAPHIALPFDSSSNSPGRRTDAQIDFMVVDSGYVEFRRLAQRYRTSLSLMILTAYVAAISLWRDTNDFLLEFVDTGRWCADLAYTVGWLVEHLVLRPQIADNDTLLDLHHRVRNEFCSASAHRDFGRIPCLLPRYTADLYFNWLPSELGYPKSVTSSMPRHRILLRPFPLKSTEHLPFALGAFFLDTGACIRATLAYSTVRFTKDSVEHLASKLRSLTLQLGQNPKAPIRGD